MYDNPNLKYRPSLIEENPVLLVWILFFGAYAVLALIAKYAWHITNRQIFELTLWLLWICVAAFFGFFQLTRARKYREESWPAQPPPIPTRGERAIVERAWRENAVILGYDVHGEPWKWSDSTRVMQALVLGQTG